MNIASLYKMQFQVLKPLSPRQEYAVFALVSDTLDTDDIHSLSDMILQDYPHMYKLYDAFISSSKYENMVPFIVPVNNSDEPTSEIFCIRDHALVVSANVRKILADAIDNAQRMLETPTERLAVTYAEPVDLGQFMDDMLDAFNTGVMPTGQRATTAQKKQRVENMLTAARLKVLGLFDSSILLEGLTAPKSTYAITAQMLGRCRRLTQKVTIDTAH